MIHTRKFQIGVVVVAMIVANLMTQEYLSKSTQSIAQTGKSEEWLVKRAVNGQVLEIQPAKQPNAKIERVVLAGVNSPLSDQQPWGKLARQYLDSLVKDQPVTLVFDGKSRDMSERPLVFVWLGDRLINREMIEQGYVLSQKIESNSSYQAQFDAAQTKARLLEVGVWDLKEPMRQTPRGFRR
jgi:micrococcal nuclease